MLLEILVQVMDPTFVCSVSLSRCRGLVAAWMEWGGEWNRQTSVMGWKHFSLRSQWGLGMAAPQTASLYLSYRKLEFALLPISCCWELRSVSGALATGVRTWRLLPAAT